MVREGQNMRSVPCSGTELTMSHFLLPLSSKPSNNTCLSRSLWGMAHINTRGHFYLPNVTKPFFTHVGYSALVFVCVPGCSFPYLVCYFKAAVPFQAPEWKSIVKKEADSIWHPEFLMTDCRKDLIHKTAQSILPGRKLCSFFTQTDKSKVTASYFISASQICVRLA